MGKQIYNHCTFFAKVCGLAWSPDGKLLASGGNDNVLNVWEAERAECYSKSTPKFRFT